MNGSEAFVYIWFDANVRMFYIGVHKGSPTDNYANSSTQMKSFKMGNVPSGFSRKILATGSYNDMVKLEITYLCNRKIPINEKYYNLVIASPRNTKETKRRQRDGIKRAKAAGKYIGRVSRYTDDEFRKICEQFIECDDKTKLAKELGISRAYLYKIAKQRITYKTEATII